VSVAKKRYYWSSVFDCVLQEQDQSGNTQVTYTHEPSTYGPLVSENRGGQESQYHFDALGSTRALTDNSHTVTGTFIYDAWGRAIRVSGATDPLFKWCGTHDYLEDSPDRKSVRHRIYSSATGAWLSRDPLDLFAKVAPYTYCHSTPARDIDPSGLVTASVKTNTFPAVGTLRDPCPTVGRQTFAVGIVVFNTTQAELTAVGNKLKAKVANLNFVQEVHITAKVIIGVSNCKCNPPCPCKTYSMDYSAVFVETFSREGTHSKNTDSNSAVHYPEYRSALESACGVKQQPCCPWEYHTITEKRVSIGEVPANNSATLVEKSAGYDCDGNYVVDASPIDPPSMPANRHGHPVDYPANSPAAAPKSKVLLDITHPQCANAQWKAAWSGYQ